MYQFLEPADKKSIPLAILAVEKLAKGCETIYPASRSNPDLSRFLHSYEAKLFQVRPVSTMEWIEAVIRNNMDAFNLDGGWSDIFTNNTLDLRIEEYDDKLSVVVVPWDKDEKQHDMDNTWLLFSLA